nr:5195_t:CDS:2 [Entrophospora candida]
MVANEKQRKRFGDIKSIVNEFKGSSAVNKNKRYEKEAVESRAELPKSLLGDEQTDQLFLEELTKNSFNIGINTFSDF